MRQQYIAFAAVPLRSLKLRLAGWLGVCLAVCLIGLASAPRLALAGPQPSAKTRAGAAQAPCLRCIYGSWPTALAVSEGEGARLGGFGWLAPAGRLHLVQDTAASFQVEPLSGVAGTAIPLRIRLPASLTEGSGAGPARRFLMLRRLPEGVTLSAGFSTRNSWVVALKDVGDLTLNVPAGYQGRFSIEVLLHRGETEVPERQMLSVEVSPSPKRTAVAAPVGSAGGPPRTASPARPGVQGAPALSKEDEPLLALGGEHLRNGNIASARVLFEELAARGSPQGAFAMAQTFDPSVLEQLRVVGIQGDVDKAKYWYRKAAELGNSPPVDILSALKKDRPSE